uniref:DUF4939 domain-containing protein n=1 Tax=Oncorhynchus kisutch TaxID=8019 RepID=A0A8C7GDK7_ONCKI
MTVSVICMYPHVPRTSRLPPFTVTGGRYYCIARYITHGWDIGKVRTCNRTENVTTDETMRDLTGWLRSGDFSKIKRARADVWWLCGGMTLLPNLSTNWTGLCALVHLGMPFTLIQHHDIVLARWEKRSSPSGSFDDRVYIDNIGVPDEFKARNQILAGLESSIFCWSTLNKNVDWINYIYYNQQRFINYTRDAIKGLADQTEATSLMAWQNRITLDMLLAEKGGVLSRIPPKMVPLPVRVAVVVVAAVLHRIGSAMDQMMERMERWERSGLPTSTAAPPQTTPPTKPTSPSGSSTLRLSPPKEYDGAAAGCQGFLLQLVLTLATVCPTPSGEESVSLLVSCLSGRALDWANAVWNSPDTARDHYLEFTRRFRAVFDHSPEGKAGG